MYTSLFFCFKGLRIAEVQRRMVGALISLPLLLDDDRIDTSFQMHLRATVRDGMVRIFLCMLRVCTIEGVLNILGIF